MCLSTGQLLFLIVYHSYAQSWSRDLFNWIFPPLIQAELNGFRNWWNSHTIRTQHNKMMPSGHVPLDALRYPHLHGGLKCLVEVTPQAIQHLRAYLEEEVGPRSAHLDWVSQDFAVMAVDIHKSIGALVITFANSWHVFLQMLLVIETLP